MARGAVVAQGTNGPISWAIKAHGPLLEIFGRSERNEMVRGALEVAGKKWGAAFLAKRFTDYVERSPFNYPRHRDGFYLNKARRMGILAPIFNRLFMGWDPWSTNKPPFALIQAWKANNPERYKFTGVYGVGLIADLRTNAKRMTMESVKDFSDDTFLPLVESGSLRDSVLSGVSYRATASSKRQKLRVSMPLGLRSGQTVGKGGTNKRVVEILRTIPGWELRFIGNNFGENLALRLANRGYTMDARGMITQRAAPDFQSQQNARAFTAASGRAAP